MFQLTYKLLSHLKNFKFIFSSIWTIIILYLSLGRIHSPKEISELFPHFDKFVHFGMYAILSTLLLFEFRESTKKNIIIVIMLYSITFGILMEVLQANITTYRSADYTDAIFNTLGAISALAFFILYKKSIKK